MKTPILSTFVTWMTVVATSMTQAQTMNAGAAFMNGYGPAPGAYPVSQANYIAVPAGYAPVQLASHCDAGGSIGCDASGIGPVYGGDGSAYGCGCGAGGGGCGGGMGCGLAGGDRCGAGLGGGLGAGMLNPEWGAHGYGGYGSQCFGQQHGPFGSGGCCLPRWFDFSAEWLYWDRDFGESLVVSSEGVLGPAALSAANLEIEHESGVRITGAYVIAPATAIEASYFGTLNWASEALATSDGNLFSVFSEFGTNPGAPQFGFPETDRSTFHSLALSSALDNGELNLRHRWVSANCLIHSSWLVGARYVRVAEDLVHNTEGASGGMNYVLQTDNDLVGAQVGTDALICITPRFKIGGEVEAGVYGSRSKQRTDILSFRNIDGVRIANAGRAEFDTTTDVSFVGEAGILGLFRVTPRFTVKAGYQVLFIAGVAEATANFNTQSPFSANRTSFINNDGDIFYHGSNLGFEWTW